MDISNSLVPSGLRDLVKSGRQLPRNQETLNQKNAQGTTLVDVSRQTVSTNPDLLAKKSNEFQQSKLQRLNALEGAPTNIQQAVNRYQQTVDAGKSFDQGELVGIDLFV